LTAKVYLQGKLHFSDSGYLILPMPPVRRGRALFREPNIRFDEHSKEFFIRLQQREPQVLPSDIVVYKNQVFRVEGESEKNRAILLIKQFVLRRERDDQRLKAEVEALENFEKMDNASRAPIPEKVRIFVWQRDGGKCVRCGRRELLEFDHIIPVAKGGSSTERNVQLLCEPCNRSKSSTI
jgi:hypothetical protein